MSEIDSVRTRVASKPITGTWSWGGSGNSINDEAVTFRQRTVSHETLFPLYNALLKREISKRRSGLGAWFRWAQRQDWGTSFITEKTMCESSLNGLTVAGRYSSNNYAVNTVGPVLLTGFNGASALRSSLEEEQEAQVMFGLGSTAISRVRPNKPTVNLAVTIGELRNLKEIPKMLGSIMARSETLRDIFRNSGSEYLNVQFGWAPLVRDVIGLAQIVSNSRALLEQHEREIDRLVRRRYQFDTQVNTEEKLSKTISSQAYELRSTSVGSQTQLVSTRASVNAPVEITSTVVKSYFSGAFRIYDPELHFLEKRLAEFENNANTLLGTRLDPEVLWNLQPWTWLFDWVFNFGDILGNISAFSDGIVMQYGYLMREENIRKDIRFSSGVWSRTGTSTWVRSTDPLEVTLTTLRKRRVKASPFGFGLDPETFTESQWAILLALGMSKGLK